MSDLYVLKNSIKNKVFDILVHYTELTFEFNNNSTTLFDDVNTFQTICKLEWNLRTRFTNCNETCCQSIGPGRREYIYTYDY